MTHIMEKGRHVKVIEVNYLDFTKSEASDRGRIVKD
jgi:hypothetical protein